MRIWIVNHYAVPPSEPGGTRHYSLARELVRHGHEVYIICSDVNHWTREKTGQNRAAFNVEVFQEVPFVRLPVPRYGDGFLGRARGMFTFAVRLISANLSQLPPPEVVIGSSPHPLAAWGALRLARRFGAPFILEVRDLWPQTLIDLGRASPRNILVKSLFKLENHLYKSASAIITLLPGGRDYISQRGISIDKIVWIPNGMDGELIDRPLPPEEKDMLNVMYLGAHGLANGLDTLLEAAQLLKMQGWEDRISFRFIGEGPHKRFLRETARKLGLSNINFEPAVPRTQVSLVLAQADVVVVLLKKSGLYRWGISLNKIYDYLAAARPVIIGIDALNNPVQESGGGLSIPPEDPFALAETIKRIWALPKQEKWEMGLKGRSYVEKHHDYSVLGARLEEVICEVAKKRHAGC